MFIDIDGEKVKTLNVPYYENLTLADMWKFAAEHQEINRYLPAEEDQDDEESNSGRIFQGEAPDYKPSRRRDARPLDACTRLHGVHQAPLCEHDKM